LNSDQKILKELIKECQRGKREAQKALYKMHYSFSLGICMRYATSKEQAQEVMNDGFMKVFKYIEKFDSDRPFLPWLKQILVNCSIDSYNKEQKRVKEDDLESGMNKGGGDSTLDEITYDEMLEMIRELPAAYQTVFNLRAIEGYKHEEIAEMLGISVGTSKSNFSRAKEKLRKYLDTYFEIGS
jgi:RNA polymerase sigma factor (sigma-70 family)